MKKESWQKRYPEVGFYLSFFPFEEVTLPTSLQELETWLDGIVLDEVEVLYVVGLLDAPLPKKIEAWLQEKKEHALVFIEDRLGAFAGFTHDELLENPQIHFHYATEDSIERLAQVFPIDRLAIFEGRDFDSALLKRRSATLSALYSDVLYSHKIVDNVVTNLNRLQGCFAAKGSFENVPAIICGAGPSLEKALPVLEEHSNKALVIAGGSAITALTKAGVQPHLAMALDPNDEEFDRLKQAQFFEGPFLFSPRLHKDVFLAANGPYGYLKSDTGGLIENYLEEALGLGGAPIGPDLGEEAFSVTTLAVSYAFAMGCNPIILVGADLAFTGGRRYAGGVEAEEKLQRDPRALEERLFCKDMRGNEVETLRKWVMEADCLSNFAKKHPERTFLNATDGGLGFSHIPSLSLEKALLDKPEIDLSSLIHQWIQSTPLTYHRENFTSAGEEFGQSLSRCLGYINEILQRLEEGKTSGKMALLVSDFSDELAYTTILCSIDIALCNLLTRYHPNLDPAKAMIERDTARYTELKRQVELFLPLFPSEVAHV